MEVWITCPIYVSIFKIVKLFRIFPAAFPQDVFSVDVDNHRFAHRCCRTTVWCKTADFRIVNSTWTHLQMESGEAGLYDYVIISCLWSLRLPFYLNTPSDKRQHRGHVCCKHGIQMCLTPWSALVVRLNKGDWNVIDYHPIYVKYDQDFYYFEGWTFLC